MTISINWGKIIATAQAIMSYSVTNKELSVESGYSLSGAAYLLKLALLSDEILDEHKSDIALNCGVAFAMSGDSSKAEDIISNHFLKKFSKVSTDGEKLICAIVAPSTIDSNSAHYLFANSSQSLAHLEFLEKYREYLNDKNKNPELLKELESNFVKLIFDGDNSFEISFIQHCIFILRHHR